jgi:hypothetical protein
MESRRRTEVSTQAPDPGPEHGRFLCALEAALQALDDPRRCDKRRLLRDALSILGADLDRHLEWEEATLVAKALVHFPPGETSADALIAGNDRLRARRDLLLARFQAVEDGEARGDGWPDHPAGHASASLTMALQEVMFALRCHVEMTGGLEAKLAQEHVRGHVTTAAGGR